MQLTLPEVQRPSERDLQRTVEYAYERYFQRGALFGSVDNAAAVLDKAIAVGVTEVACLMDFGVPRALVLESLPYLDEVKARHGARAPSEVTPARQYPPRQSVPRRRWTRSTVGRATPRAIRRRAPSPRSCALHAPTSCRPP
jgi:hypothetical protein